MRCNSDDEMIMMDRNRKLLNLKKKKGKTVMEVNF